MPPFRIYRDFLPPEDNRALIDWTVGRQRFFAPSTLVGQIHDPSRRSSMSLQPAAGKSWRDPIRRRIDALVPGCFADLGIAPCDVSLKQFEMVAYEHGAYFTPHIDTMTGPNREEVGDRVLSGVYYFHREPKRFTGGALRIHAFGAEGEGSFVDVAPEQNLFVLFPSWARHEVREVLCPSKAFADSRFAVNCWLYRPRRGGA